MALPLAPIRGPHALPTREMELPKEYFKEDYFVHNNLVAYSKDKKTLVRAARQLEGSYTILDGTKSIAKNAFYDCKRIRDIIIPDSVNYIV